MFRIVTLVFCAVLPGLAGPARADSFERFHPDQYFSRLAVQQVRQGNVAAAVTSFERAARYGEKGSQLALALAHWNGEGVPLDRPRGYAWADLAAERGYPSMLAVREQMWAALSPEEQERAKAIGAELVGAYADSATKPRINRLLHQGLRKKTGTRTGSGTVGTGTAIVDSSARASMISAMYTSMSNNVVPGQEEAFPGAKMVTFAAALQSVQEFAAPGYYSDSNWRPKQYWQMQDELWRDVPRGMVKVEPLRRVEEPESE